MAVLESSSDFPETVNEGKKNGFGAFEVWLHHFSSDLNYMTSAWFKMLRLLLPTWKQDAAKFTKGLSYFYSN